MPELGFVQEVIATDVVIELGGEDAKILYLINGPEQRMNGTCAGGTGSFIDRMAILLKTDATGLNALAEKHTHIYKIAARCGVFAKSDVQPLLNEGAAKEDVAFYISVREPGRQKIVCQAAFRCVGRYRKGGN